MSFRASLRRVEKSILNRFLHFAPVLSAKAETGALVEMTVCLFYRAHEDLEIMHRFFVTEESLRGQQVVFAAPQAHQIRNVLRMKPGEQVIVLDNTGCEYMVILTKISPQEVIGGVISKQQAQGEPHTQITLYQSLLAREKFEWVLQKCTEVGVTCFVPIVTERSIVRRQGAVTQRKLSRWRRIVTEAAEQSGRGRIPQIKSPVNFADAISGLDGFDRCLIGTPEVECRVGIAHHFSIGVHCTPYREILRAGNAEPTRKRRIALLIGPEGGFTDDEVADACSKGAKAFSLGKRVLRTETAAVVTSTIILYELGELVP